MENGRTKTLPQPLLVCLLRSFTGGRCLYVEKTSSRKRVKEEKGREGKRGEKGEK
jgi:hypothetical protein